MAATVFYAWQSDRDERACHYLIRDATKDAIKKLASDATVDEAPTLDYGTLNVSGAPHVAETIKKKIRDCAVFLADLTYVASYETADGRAKMSPNPNVMAELGVAIEARGVQHL